MQSNVVLLVRSWRTAFGIVIVVFFFFNFSIMDANVEHFFSHTWHWVSHLRPEPSLNTKLHEHICITSLKNWMWVRERDSHKCFGWDFYSSFFFLNKLFPLVWSSWSQPKIDYCPVRAHPHMFNSCYTTEICQLLLFFFYYY